MPPPPSSLHLTALVSSSADYSSTGLSPPLLWPWLFTPQTRLSMQSPLIFDPISVDWSSPPSEGPCQCSGPRHHLGNKLDIFFPSFSLINAPISVILQPQPQISLVPIPRPPPPALLPFSSFSHSKVQHYTHPLAHLSAPTPRPNFGQTKYDFLAPEQLEKPPY